MQRYSRELDAQSRCISRMRSLLLALVLTVASLSACATETAPRFVPTAHDVQASWSATPTFPGNSFVMALQESSGTVTGTGTFAGEAGPFGALAISGSATPDSVHLQIVYKFDPIFNTLRQDTAQFSGALVTLDSLRGTLTRGGTASAATYLRLKIGDPAR